MRVTAPPCFSRADSCRGVRRTCARRSAPLVSVPWSGGTKGLRSDSDGGAMSAEDAPEGDIRCRLESNRPAAKSGEKSVDFLEIRLAGRSKVEQAVCDLGSVWNTDDGRVREA